MVIRRQAHRGPRKLADQRRRSLRFSGVSFTAGMRARARPARRQRARGRHPGATPVEIAQVLEDALVRAPRCRRCARDRGASHRTATGRPVGSARQRLAAPPASIYRGMQASVRHRARISRERRLRQGSPGITPTGSFIEDAVAQDHLDHFLGVALRPGTQRACDTNLSTRPAEPAALAASSALPAKVNRLGAGRLTVPAGEARAITVKSAGPAETASGCGTIGIAAGTPGRKPSSGSPGRREPKSVECRKSCPPCAPYRSPATFSTRVPCA